MRTIIDILRKGNQELFHSSMIAWLLDPTAEHGIGFAFLRGFADTLATQGSPQLKETVAQKQPSIQTETTSHKRRYDIEIKVGDARFVIENKTKRLGDMAQFRKYDDTNLTLIALGLCDISFSPEVASVYPVVTYGDILDILKRVNIRNDNPFHTLVGEYRSFLARELSLLDFIDSCYGRGDTHAENRIAVVTSQLPGYTNNDRRFLNLYYLERLKQWLSVRPEMRESEWRTGKNEISGVWLANIDKLPKGHILSEWMTELCRTHKACVWFHIELRAGVTANDWDDIAGIMQLRCQSQGDNRKFINDFVTQYAEKLEEGQHLPSRTSSRSTTFYCLAKRLRRDNLPFDRMMEAMTSFMRTVGVFN